MTTIAIMPETPGSAGTGYRAIAGAKQAVGKTAGEALDALSSQLSESESGTLVVVQQQRPDQFFTALQHERLQELMARWRTARETGSGFPDPEQKELESLIDEEVRAAAIRAATLTPGREKL